MNHLIQEINVEVKLALHEIYCSPKHAPSIAADKGQQALEEIARIITEYKVRQEEF